MLHPVCSVCVSQVLLLLLFGDAALIIAAPPSHPTTSEHQFVIGVLLRAWVEAGGGGGVEGWRRWRRRG